MPCDHDMKNLCNGEFCPFCIDIAERAGILEYDAGMTRKEAEEKAWEELKEWWEDLA